MKPLKGDDLTQIAITCYGIRRKVWFWIFKESDQSLRDRCRAAGSMLVVERPLPKPRFWS